MCAARPGLNCASCAVGARSERLGEDREGDVGVWLALVRPTETDFGIAINQRIWAAEIASREGATADFKDWTSFAFGEPSVTVLADGTLFVTLWARQPSGHGIRYVKLRIQH